jgi:hypothetical protein
MMLRLAIALVRAWTYLFTVGMPHRVRQWRRAEIACDLWEQSHDRRPAAGQVIWRLLRGIPADILWRLEEEAMHSGKMIVVAASLGATVGAGAMWLYEAMRVDFLPTPPPIQVEVGAPWPARSPEWTWMPYGAPVKDVAGWTLSARVIQFPPPPPPPPPPPARSR